MTLDLPPAYFKNVITAFGEAGHFYLAELPHLLAEASNR